MKIKLKVIKKRGEDNCLRFHKIGDEFIIEEGKTPEGLCCSAFNSIWPFARTLLITGNKKEECSIICPDGVLEYELKLAE
ncbi:MAG: TIGR04076 family protein [archaeon]